jgi:HEAT repeat protein
MKKALCFFALVSFVAFAGFADSEDAESYIFVYNFANTHSVQLGILQSMAEEDDLGDMGEFYAGALQRLFSGYYNITDPSERHAANEQAKLLAWLLREEGYTDAAPDVWRVAELFSDPMAKATAMETLGEFKATTYLPHVIRVLHNMNVAPTVHREDGERIAYGAIVALEKFQEPDGYIPVFMAASSSSWYTKRVRERAKEALPAMADDPTPFIVEIISGPEYDYLAKTIVLQEVEQSDLSDESKAEIAVAALRVGWNVHGSGTVHRGTISMMRLEALRLLAQYKTEDESVYPLLERSYLSAYDIDEKHAAANALGALGTDEAVEILSRFLMDMNAKRMANNIRPEEERLVRALIVALAVAKNPKGKPALRAVTALEWTNSVKVLARRALEEIG